MPRLVELNLGNDRSVWINPSQICSVEDGGKGCRVVMSDGQTFPVPTPLARLAEYIASPGEGGLSLGPDHLIKLRE